MSYLLVEEIKERRCIVPSICSGCCDRDGSLTSVCCMGSWAVPCVPLFLGFDVLFQTLIVNITALKVIVLLFLDPFAKAHCEESSRRVSPTVLSLTSTCADFDRKRSLACH